MEALAEAPQTFTTPLADGDHLTRAEFERRYDEMPFTKKAELIEGIVHMGSPVNRPHARAHSALVTWLGTYAAYHEGLELSDNVSVRIDLRNEFQPDVCLTHVEDDGEGMLDQPPELAAEISVSSVSYDLHTKKAVYERAGVKEYIVWVVQEKCLHWWHLDETDNFVEIAPSSADGLLHSKVFQGLKLDREALLSGDLKKVIAAVS